jgi:hypothetical protein
MPPDPAPARIVHRLPGRLRLLVPTKRGVPSYFDQLALSLATFRGVQSVRTSARAASVVIQHVGAADAILDGARAEGLFDASLDPNPAEEAAPAWRPRDLDHLLVLGFALAGVLQLLRGQVLPPALSLFSYALALERGGSAGAHPHEDADGDGDGDG